MRAQPSLPSTQTIVAVLRGTDLVLRTVFQRMIKRRLFGKYFYPTLAVLCFGLFAYFYLYEFFIGKASRPSRFLDGSPFLVLIICLFAIWAFALETAWFAARTSTHVSAIQLPRLEWSLALAVVCCGAFFGCLYLGIQGGPIGGPQWVSVLPAISITISIGILLASRQRRDRLMAIAIIAISIMIAFAWMFEFEAYLNRIRPQRWESDYFGWTVEICIGFWLFIMLHSLKGFAYGVVVAVGVSAFEWATGFSFRQLCYQSPALSVYLLVVATAAVIYSFVGGSTHQRRRRWGLATLTMRDLSAINDIFNASSLNPQQRMNPILTSNLFAWSIEHALRTPGNRIQLLMLGLMRVHWRRSAHFAAIFVAVLIGARLFTGDLTTHPTNTMVWAVMSALLVLINASLNTLCLTTDRNAQLALYLTPGWPPATSLNMAIARHVVYGSVAETAIVLSGLMLMVPFSVNPQYWLIPIAASISACFISIALTLHPYAQEKPSTAAFNAVGAVLCLVPAIVLIELANRRLPIAPTAISLIMIFAAIAIFRTHRFQRGDWVIPLGLRYRA